MSSVIRRRLTSVMFSSLRSGHSGDPGKGVGKGGGSGGSIREAGGSFGKKEAAHEEEYFRRQQREQLQKLKATVEQEVTHHEDSIKKLEDEIKRHKERITDLNTTKKELE